MDTVIQAIAYGYGTGVLLYSVNGLVKSSYVTNRRV